MKTFHKKRLLKLAAFLRTVPKKNFKLDWWIDFGKELDSKKIANQELDIFRKVGNGKKLDCKTAACAIGWCPNVFPKLCSWEIDEAWGVYDATVMSKTTDEGGFGLGCELFGITNRQSEYLFDSSTYRHDHKGPISVAKRIEQFVKSDGKIPSQFQ